MSLITCSFSTANLLSRDKDLGAVRKDRRGGGGSCDELDYMPIDRVFFEFSDGFEVNECMAD